MKISSPSRVDVAYESVRRQIGQHDELLPPVRLLAEEIGVSRDSVWRAIKRLAEEDLVEPIGKRYRVKKRTDSHPLSLVRLVFIANGVDQIAPPLFQRFYDRLKDQAQAYSMSAQLVLVPPGQDLEPGLLESYDIAICAVMPASHQPEKAALPIPVIGVNTLAQHGYDSRFFVDDFAGGCLVGAELAARDYRRVVVIHSIHANQVLANYEQRLLGFYKGWIDAQRSMDDVKVFRLSPTATRLSIARQMHEFFSQSGDVDVVFGLDDNFAIAAADVLKELGRSVPDQVGVVGFDGSVGAYFHEPPLATVRQPMELIADEVLVRVRALSDGTRSELGDIMVKPMFEAGASLRPMESEV